VLGYTNNDLSVAERRDALLAVLAHAAHGDVIVSHDPLPLAEVGQGWERQRAGAAGGRIVVTV
jgi:hypothetical protein